MELTGLHMHRRYYISEVFIHVLRFLDYSIDKVDARCVCPMYWQASQGQESAELVWEAGKVICGTGMGHEAECALIEGHLGVSCHERIASAREQGSSRVKGVSRSQGHDWLVSRCHLRLKLVELL